VCSSRAGIKASTAGLQKVSAQLAAVSPSGGGLEASKFATGRIRRDGPAPQVAKNPKTGIGVGAVSQRLIPTDEQSGLQTHMWRRKALRCASE